MVGGFTYLLFLILYLVFFTFAYIYLYKNDVKISTLQVRVLFIFIAICYSCNLFEKIFSPTMNLKHVEMCIPFGNFSPFLFSICTIMIFMPKRIIELFYRVITLFTIPMFFASLYNTIGFIISFPSDCYVCLIYDAFEHGLFALLGFYLIKNNIVEFNKKDIVGSLIFAYSVFFIMLILNIIFDTNFFGLNLNGRHNIYSIVLTSNSYLSALIYFIGLTLIFVGSIFLIKKFKEYQIKKRNSK